MVGEVIVKFGTDEQQRAWVPRLTSGAGARRRLRAVRAAGGLRSGGDGDDGQAHRRAAGGSTAPSSGSPPGDRAGVFVVWAKTDPDGRRQGHQRLRRRAAARAGCRPASTRTRWACAARRRCRCVLDGCELPEDALLGKVGGGLSVALAALDGGRIGIASQALGIGQRRARRRARLRQAARAVRPAASPSSRRSSSASPTSPPSSRRRACSPCARRGSRSTGRPFSREASMAKLYASEAAWRACDAAIQLHGGYGYTRDFPVERYARDCRVTRIYEGTSEVQRIVIARSLLQNHGTRVRKRMTEKRKIRILVAKPGLDGHDRGAKVVARALSDAGYEVVYTGLHQTPEMIAAAAVQESVDAVGLSIMSGAHMTLFPAVIEALKTRGAGDVLVFGGGIIPDEDVVPLKQGGVSDDLQAGRVDAGDHRLGREPTSGPSTRAHETRSRSGSLLLARRRRSPPTKTRPWASACRICCTRTRPRCSAAWRRATGARQGRDAGARDGRRRSASVEGRRAQGRDRAADARRRACRAKMQKWDLTSLKAAAGDQVVFPLVFKPEALKKGEKRVLVPMAAQEVAGPQRFIIDDQSIGEPPLASVSMLTLPGNAVVAGQAAHRRRRGDGALRPRRRLQARRRRGQGGRRVWLGAHTARPAIAPADKKPLKLLEIRAHGEGTGQKIVHGAEAKALQDRRRQGHGQAAPRRHAAPSSPSTRSTPTPARRFRRTSTQRRTRISTSSPGARRRRSARRASRRRRATRCASRRTPAHAMKVTEPVRAIQIYAPGGPEQRFKKEK